MGWAAFTLFVLLFLFSFNAGVGASGNEIESRMPEVAAEVIAEQIKAGENINIHDMVIVGDLNLGRLQRPVTW